MVRFCIKCERAVDDLDKFCRECGNSTKDSIDYHTYYDFFRSKIPIKESGSVGEKVDIVAKKVETEGREGKKEEKKEDNANEHVADTFMLDFHVLNKEDIEKELSQIEKKFGMAPDEFYKAWKEGKLHGFDATKLGSYYEMYIGDYGTYEMREKEEIIEEKPLEIKVEEKEKKEEEIIEEKPLEIKVEEKGIKDEDRGIPQEVNDKLDLLLQEDTGQRQAIQYLIQKYSKGKSKGEDRSSDNNVPNNGSNSVGLTIIPKEEVIRVGRSRGKGKEKKEPYGMYETAIHKFIPDILEKIGNSKDGKIRIRLLDIARQMGDQFIDKKPVTLYSGLKYSLFDHNIVVEMGSLKDVDPITGQNIKVLVMRMKNPDDKLPPSMEQRREDI